MNTREIGAEGEERAAAFLVQKGFTLIERNYRSKLGELDLVAEAPDKTLCFIEVKSAKSLNWGDPSFNVNNKKQRQIWKLAEQYLAVRKIKDRACRFDVVSVDGSRITHYPDAFRLSGPAAFV